MPSKNGEDDDEEKRESWFTGGERSGLSVQNPGRDAQVPGGDVVRDLLRRAAEGGPAPEAAAKSKVFSGGGHKLGGDDQESEYIPDPENSAVGDAPQIRHLTFWQDGFSIEDGPLMRHDDPGNSQILDQVKSGLAPPSVLNVLPGQPVEVRITNRTHENYTPPNGQRLFSGTGHRLGAPVAAVSSSSGMPGSFPGTSSSSSGADLYPERESLTTLFEVDETLPTTSVQIRLADGTKMNCRMNLTHTVQDLRNFINASRPENSGRLYTIGTTFPVRILEDNGATIEGANLQNTVVVQRWK